MLWISVADWTSKLGTIYQHCSHLSSIALFSSNVSRCHHLQVPNPASCWTAMRLFSKRRLMACKNLPNFGRLKRRLSSYYCAQCDVAVNCISSSLRSVQQSRILRLSMWLRLRTHTYDHTHIKNAHALSVQHSRIPFIVKHSAHRHDEEEYAGDVMASVKIMMA